MDQRFIRSFVLVTAVMAAAVYLAAPAAKRGGVVLTAFAVLTGAVALLGFTALARFVVIVERKRSQR